MRVFIAGVDGYLGWSLALHLSALGHEISGADAFLRRDWVAEVGSHSATPIRIMSERCAALRERVGVELDFRRGNLCDFEFVVDCLRELRPDAVVHLGEMPSAPYSMLDAAHCAFTQSNNLVTTLNLLHAMRAVCPDAHLLKLGTMGEYGTPNVDIPEGFFEIEYRGRRDTLPFPKLAGSWYHLSKVHDSNNVMFACRVWGLRSTDIMQGVVFGARIAAMGDDERLATRFDFDQCFGTVVNRYVAQAVIGHPLTPYGAGRQKRGFLPLEDSMQCLTLALEHPPGAGEYRVFNQFAEVYDVTQLAEAVKRVAERLGLRVEIRPLDNPRAEPEDHYFNPDRRRLLDLGYQPTRDLDGVIAGMLAAVLPHRDRILAKKEALLPDIRWDGARRKSTYLDLEPGLAAASEG